MQPETSDEQKLERTAQKTIAALGALTAALGATDIFFRGETNTVHFGSEGTDKKLSVFNQDGKETAAFTNQGTTVNELPPEEIQGVGKQLQAIAKGAKSIAQPAITKEAEL